MRQWMGLVAVGLVVGLGSPSFGQMGGWGGMGGGMGGDYRNFGDAGAETANAKVVPVAMDTTDGKTTTGELKLTAAVVGCSLGIYEIKPEKIQAIRFDPLTKERYPSMDQAGTQRPGAIVTVTGEVIEGVILIPRWWRIQTDLGVLTPNSVKIKSITFTHPEGSQTYMPDSSGLIPAPGDREEPLLVPPPLPPVPRSSAPVPDPGSAP